jgi:hypothetical protein
MAPNNGHMTKLYPYVGPPRIWEQARHQPPGLRIQSVEDLVMWTQGAGAARGGEVTATFVVDEAGHLRLADRHSEHVACAQGQPVRSAGEMTFAMIGPTVRVTAVTNQSTGYCPEPASWPEVQRALNALGVAHPGDFTTAFDFRRCPPCGQINLIKDGVLRCDACDAELPAAWNFGA